MAYFEDLSPYAYHAHPLPDEVQVLNVGWLDGGREFPAGEVAPTLVEKLDDILREMNVQQMRGSQHCNLGPLLDEEADKFKYQGPTQVGMTSPRVCSLDHVHQDTPASSAEIWIPHGNRFYASPKLIGHYVRDHHYLPPAEWLAALEAFDLAEIPALNAKLDGW